jgi:hypothetical protein
LLGDAVRKKAPSGGGTLIDGELDPPPHAANADMTNIVNMAERTREGRGMAAERCRLVEGPSKKKSPSYFVCACDFQSISVTRSNQGKPVSANGNYEGD